MGVLIVGDVGAIGSKYHAGDEAMLAGAIDELTARGVSDLTVVSADPVDTTTRYGLRSIGSLASTAPSSSTRDDRGIRREKIMDVARGRISRRGWDDPAAELIDEVATCDGLLVSGGGNLTSLWPEHIIERSTLAMLANHFGKPIVFTSQMLGPHLTDRDGELIAEMLRGANLVGVRDLHSYQMSGRLGVDAALTQLSFDDATFLRGTAPVLPSAPYCAVTVSPYTGLVESDAFFDRLALLLDSIADTTGLGLLLLPHVGSLDPNVFSDDVAVHQAIALRLKAKPVQKPILDVREIAAFTRGASLSVSTRYHPVVFAVSAGVPAVGIAVDRYTQQKIGGALANVGLTDLSVPALALASGAAANHVDRIWHDRARISEHMLAGLPAARAHQDRWWDRVAGVLTGQAPGLVQPFNRVALTIFDRATAEDVTRLLDWQAVATDTSIVSRIAVDALPSAQVSQVERDRAAGEAEAKIATAEQRINELEVALVSAQELAAVVAEPRYAQRLSPYVITPVSERVRATLTRRSSRSARFALRIYRGVRRRLLLLRRD